MFPSYICHFPSGASFNQIMHYAKVIQHGYFGKYVNNEILSDFSISRITAPITIHYSSSDNLLNVQDIDRLISEMKNVVYAQYINQTRINHMDFILDLRINSMVYSKILKVYRNYQ